ncbi:MAG: hypothetical protein LBP59_18675 [Planctomycetaceae bacterium]|jgi:hypothetical protein|nr:hypothetical protein [Planctomycetaceae bacterium]
MDTIYGLMEAIYDLGIPLAVIAALFGMRWKEKLWGNILTMFSVFFSMLIAVNWFEPLAQFATEKNAGMLFVADFLFLWLLFIVAFSIMNEMTRLLSRVNVLFPIPVENAGNFITISIILYLIWGFFSFSLDLAPLGEPAGVKVASTNTSQIAIFRQLSAGNLSAFGEKRPFDEYGEFRTDHLLRRKALLQYRFKSESFPFFYEGELPPVKGMPKPENTPNNNPENNANNPPAENT